jgi:hypothetical protein
VSTLQPVVARAPFSFLGFSIWALHLLRVGVALAPRLLVSWLTIRVAGVMFSQNIGVETVLFYACALTMRLV